MKKVSFFSSVSVLLFLALIFFISGQIYAEDDSNISNPTSTDIKKTVLEDNLQVNSDKEEKVDAVVNDAIPEENLSPEKDKHSIEKSGVDVVDDEGQPTIFSKKEVEDIKHAKAISERNKRSLVESGIIKDENPKKLILPEKEKPVVNKTVNKKEKTVEKKLDDNITEIKSAEQLTELLNDKVPVLVYFYADWSASCDLLDKTMIDISNNSNGKYDVVKVDADSCYGLCKQHEIKTLPTVILFVNGKEKDRKVGYMVKYQYENMLASISNN